jgi:hypothetical protein
MIFFLNSCQVMSNLIFMKVSAINIVSSSYHFYICVSSFLPFLKILLQKMYIIIENCDIENLHLCLNHKCLYIIKVLKNNVKIFKLTFINSIFKGKKFRNI